MLIKYQNSYFLVLFCVEWLLLGTLYIGYKESDKNIDIINKAIYNIIVYILRQFYFFMERSLRGFQLENYFMIKYFLR